MEGENRMEMAKVTSKGQITIPVSIRRRLNINEGDKLLFIDSPDGVVMVNPDMLQAGHDIESLYDPEVSSYDEDSTRREAPPRAIKEIKPATALPAGSVFAPTSVEESEPETQPISEPGKPNPKLGGLDIGALLDEIRSIGQKI